MLNALNFGPVYVLLRVCDITGARLCGFEQRVYDDDVEDGVG